MLPLLGEAQHLTSRNFLGKNLLEKARLTEGYDQAFCRSKSKPASVGIISSEIMQVNGTLQGQAKIYAQKAIILDANQVSFDLPQNWIGQTNFPQNFVQEGDSVVFNFTLTYPTTNLPFYPETFAINIGVDSTAIKTTGRAYFTPYNTVELWNEFDFYAQPRIWYAQAPQITPTRRYIPKTDIPVSDIDPVRDTIDNIPTYTVHVDGLAYGIIMKADTTLRTDTLEYDPVLQKKVVIGPRRWFEGCISGNIRSWITNDVNLRQNIPLSGIYLELLEDDGVWGKQVFARGHTDAQGNFSLSYGEWQSRWSEGNDIELSIRLHSQNQPYNIYATGGFVIPIPILGHISARLGIFKEEIFLGEFGTNVRPCANFNIQTNSGAMRSVNWAVRAWEYAEQVGGYPIDRTLRIRLHDNQSSIIDNIGIFMPNGYFGLQLIGEPTIHITIGEDDTHENTVYHEFGHFLMWILQRKNMVIPDGNPNTTGIRLWDRDWPEEAALKHAWIEGFADGMQMIFDAQHWWEDNEYGHDEISFRTNWRSGGRPYYEWRENYNAPVFGDIQRGFFSEYYMGCAIYDMWDGVGKNVPITYPNANPFGGIGIETVGFNDAFGGTNWNDDVEFSFRDILTPLVQRAGGIAAGKIHDITEYFYQFRDHVIAPEDWQARRGLARIFEANQVNNRVANPLAGGFVPSGTLSGDPIQVGLTEDYLARQAVGGIVTRTYSTVVNPNWLDYFEQTRIITITQNTSNSNFKNRHIFENFDTIGLPNVQPSTISLFSNTGDLPYTTRATPRLHFRFTNFAFFNNTVLEINDMALLEMQQGSNLHLTGNNRIIVRQGGTLHILATGGLQMDANTEIIVEPGGYICIEQGATLNLHPSAVINVTSGAILGVNPLLGIVPIGVCQEFYPVYDAIYANATQYVDLPNIDNRLSVGSGDFSFVFHLRTEQLNPQPTKYTLISTRTALNNGYQFGFTQNGTPFMQIGGTDISFVRVSAGLPFPLNDGSCNHLVLRRSNGVLQVWQQGILYYQSTVSHFQNIMGNPRLTKDRLEGTSTAFVGWLGEFQFWNKALSQTEIEDLKFNMPYRVSIIGTPTGLMAHYQFQEGADSQMVFDRMGVCHGWLGINATATDANDPSRIKYADLECVSTDWGAFRPTNVPTQSIENIEMFKAYPNPFQQDFTLEIPQEYAQGILEIYNAQGILLQKSTVEAEKVIVTPKAHWAKGVYMLRVSNPNKTATVRIVKQ